MAVLRGEDCRHLTLDLVGFGSLVLSNKRKKGDQSLPFFFLSNSPAYVLLEWSPEASTWYPGIHLLSSAVTRPKQPVGTGGGIPAGQWDSLAAPLPAVWWRAVQLATLLHHCLVLEQSLLLFPPQAQGL